MVLASAFPGVPGLSAMTLTFRLGCPAGMTKPPPGTMLGPLLSRCRMMAKAPTAQNFMRVVDNYPSW
jgi:hypothetical protein